MLSLLSLTTLKEWLWGGLVVAMGLLALHIYHAGERHETAALAVQSAKLQAQAVAQLQAQDALYRGQIASITERWNDQIQAANAQRASDAQRLRDFDAYRRAHPNVGGATQPAAGAGAGGATGSDGSFERLEPVVVELASATRDLRDALDACVHERDTLTGK